MLAMCRSRNHDATFTVGLLFSSSAAGTGRRQYALLLLSPPFEFSLLPLPPFPLTAALLPSPAWQLPASFVADAITVAVAAGLNHGGPHCRPSPPALAFLFLNGGDAAIIIVVADTADCLRPPLPQVTGGRIGSDQDRCRHCVFPEGNESTQRRDGRNDGGLRGGGQWRHGEEDGRQ